MAFLEYRELEIYQAVYLDWVIVLIAGMFYISCVIYDKRKGFDNATLELRHPSDWAPIGVTRKNHW